MTEEQIRLHEIDLNQVEKIRKLAFRLAADLQNFDKITHLIAMQEAEQDYDRLKLNRRREDQTPPEQVAERLSSEQEKVLLALKSAVWNASSNLKQDHDRRGVLKAQMKEQSEMRKQAVGKEE